jgi:hypothetical protein
MEWGVGLDGFGDIKEGDLIEAFSAERVTAPPLLLPAPWFPSSRHNIHPELSSTMLLIRALTDRGIADSL